ncbi:MAG: OB-fold domain-containing protein [Myxococcales bacterium]|nr:OB-fold domain-containing protein [Myxococcales bacterium]
MTQLGDDGILSAPHVMEYPYRRSLGPVLSRFFTGLRDGVIEGNRTASGRVLVPPMEYDPLTGDDALDEWVAVGPGGTVEGFTWIAAPRASHPCREPFAFALVKLDGADVAFLHVVRAARESDVRTGMRVTVEWAAERVGSIRDIAGFVPAEGGAR